MAFRSIFAEFDNAQQNIPDDSHLESISNSWEVKCDRCGGEMKKGVAHTPYNPNNPNVTIPCDGCQRKIPGQKSMFHCTKQKNILHPNGYDFCLNCAAKIAKNKNKSNQYQPPQQQQQYRSTYNNNINNNTSNTNNNTSYLASSSTSSLYHNNNTSNTNTNSSEISRLREIINQQQRTLDNSRTEQEKYKNEMESKLRNTNNEKNNLLREKRDINDRLNDNLEIINQQKKQISNLKYLLQTATEYNNNNNKTPQEPPTLQISQSQEIEEKYDALKQSLDDKLNEINNLKQTIENLKSEQTLKTPKTPKTVSPSKPKKSEISPTLKAIFTQKFLQDDASKKMSHQQYISKLHNEMLGMAFASQATMVWMTKNCKIYDDGGNIGNVAMFSYNQYGYNYGGNQQNENKNNNNNNHDKPIVNLKQFDLMTLNVIHKNLNSLQKQYGQCIKSTMEWLKVINDLINPTQNIQQPQRKMDLNKWRSWSSDEIVHWIVDLENRRFKTYENKLRIEMRKSNINGNDLIYIQISDLMLYGISNFKDQIALNQHIDILTGRNQKQNNININQSVSVINNNEYVYGAEGNTDNTPYLM